MMLHSQPAPTADLARHSKRKAANAPDGNERLSKRLSLLHLEQNGARLYVPVESSRPPYSPYSSGPAVQPPTPAPSSVSAPGPVPVIAAVPEAVSPVHSSFTAPSVPTAPVPVLDDVPMQVDDTKHKVYIYNIDDELASASEESDAEGDNSRLVFLSDIDKHLRSAARQPALIAPPMRLAIPRPIVPNEDGELAGMQLVLYKDPSSLSVPPEQDSVRQAILDARMRIRARQRDCEQEKARDQARGTSSDDMVGETPPRPAAASVPDTFAADPDAMDMD